MNEKSIGRLVSILYQRGLSHTGKQSEQYGIGGGQFAFLAELFSQDGKSQEALASSICCDKATVARAMQPTRKFGLHQTQTLYRGWPGKPGVSDRQSSQL
jgi:DNA-binding MarR family transcriptional regulator